MSVFSVFAQCVTSIREGVLIVRESENDKEFHFQNWVKSQVDALKINYDKPKRNTYPDLTLVDSPIGFEVKGLKYPGRDANYDSNSQVPCGVHRGRTIYYIFGRYPKKPDGNTYPVCDLVVCHGDLLNIGSDYVHENKSFRGFGSYGDIMIRDRKMYVAPTPYALLDGTAHHCTLILPAEQKVEKQFVAVGEFTRREVDEFVISYRFDLKQNVLTTQKDKNPNAGREHHFRAYRLHSDPHFEVSIRSKETVIEELQRTVSKMDSEDKKKEN